MVMQHCRACFTIKEAGLVRAIRATHEPNVANNLRAFMTLSEIQW